jgi:hypothetical protein
VQVLSRRSAASWSSKDIAIEHTSATGAALGTVEYQFFDPELSLAALQPFGEFIPQLSEEASESTAYLHDLGDSCGSSCFRPLVTGKAGFANVAEGTVFGEEQKCKAKVKGNALAACGPEFTGASEDLRHVVLRSEVELQSGAGPGLYEWSDGTLAPVSLLPGAGGAEPNSFLGLEGKAARRAISSGGSRIEWSTAEALYQRDTNSKETAQLDEGCENCESGAGRFQIASADGLRVFFTDTRRLSEDSGASEGKGEADLYECTMTVREGKLSCALTDLTPIRGGEGANVQGSILGASEDGSEVYFVAKGVLSEAGNAQGQHAVKEQPNLYLLHDGAMSFVATLSGGDSHDWSIEKGTPVPLSGQPTRVSNNGQWLELMSQAPLTGYDNHDATTEKPAAEVYLFNASSGRLECASCEPSGVRPSGIESRKLEAGNGGLVGGNGVWPLSALVAANVPGWTSNGGAGKISRYQPRYLSGEGRLFFDTAAALVPQDANGTQDVYEYEPPGLGSCNEESPSYSARSAGCVNLISSGASAQESAFMDASESGDDVFFLSSAKLSPLDTDTARDIYDAHVCSASSPCISFSEVQSPPCTTEASCKAAPTPQPSIFGAPASATFQGPGNIPPPTVTTPPKLVPHPKALTRAQKLKKALSTCKKHKSKKTRSTCEKKARRTYGRSK